MDIMFFATRPAHYLAQNATENKHRIKLEQSPCHKLNDSPTSK